MIKVFMFKEKDPMEKIGFSKFTELHPRHCGKWHTCCLCCTINQNVALSFIQDTVASGTHAVCVVPLTKMLLTIIVGGKITEFSACDDITLKEYGHCLAKIICNPPQPDCYFQI